MFHLLAYTASNAAGATDADTPGVTDSYATLQNNHYILQRPAAVKAAYGLGASITRFKVSTPRLRSVALPYIEPFDVAATQPSLPAIAWLGDRPIQIGPLDETAVLLSNSAGAAERETAALWCWLQDEPAPVGPEYTLRGTFTPPTGTFAWAISTFTLDQTLPAGTYAVVGMDVIGVNILFARLVFPAFAWRPGVLARTARTQQSWRYFRHGNAGLFGTFVQTAQPLIDTFLSGAPAASEVMIDVIKVA